MYLRHGKVQLLAKSVVTAMLEQYAYDVGGLSNREKSRFKFINHKVTNDCGEADSKTRRVAFDIK